MAGNTLTGRVLFLVPVLLIVSACTTVLDGVENSQVAPCTVDTSKAAKAADWSQAERLTVNVRDGLYDEGLLTMWAGRPYVIRINNHDRYPAYFRSPAFFKNASLQKVVYKGETTESHCFQSVAVAPGQFAEIFVVPSKAGEYEFKDTPFSILPIGELVLNSDIGLIAVYKE